MFSKIKDGVGENEGGWFAERVSKVLGDGKNTYFWLDRWVGEVPLCRRFARLFDITTNKLSTVAEMHDRDGEDGGEEWNWRRRLWVWEEELVEECRTLLTNVVLQQNVSDRWQWELDKDEGYKVRDAYHALTHMAAPPPDATSNLAWHKQVPQKVSIVAWRLLQDRLPTKINLQRRGITQVTDTSCVSGCGKEETTSHLFLHCHVFGAIWQHIRSWIGVSGADTDNVPDHIQQFIHYSGYTKARRSFLQLLWLLCVWLVWNERNSRLFNNTETSIDQLLDKAKYHSLWWLKANNITFVHGTQTWWSNPFYCGYRLTFLYLYSMIHCCYCVLPGWRL